MIKSRQQIATGCILLLWIALMFINPVSAQEWAKKQLNESPRHHEWVKVSYQSRVVESFLVFPEVSNKSKAIIVIHENRGLNDWARSIADQLAGEGFIAIAPDLLSGSGPGNGKTSDFDSPDEAREAIYALSPDQVTKDLNAVFEYVSKLPACNGQVTVIGFCWGGSQAFRYVTNQTRLKSAFVCYGRGPENPEEIARIETPVYGFYGGNDARVNATIPNSEKLMQNAGKVYQPEIYEGAGHGFFRSGESPDANTANLTARKQAWDRLIRLLKSDS